MSNESLFEVECASPEAALLGESPVWHAEHACLYYVDIPGHELRRFDPATSQTTRWPLPSEPGCVALTEAGELLIAARNGLNRFDLASGQMTPLAAPPYDPKALRFNDGKPDPAGRLWVGTIDDARTPNAALYCYAASANAQFVRMADGITVSNGLAWSPDGTRMYWSDTKAHTVYALDFDVSSGAIGERRVFASFAPRAPEQSLDDYGGRPDGAAVDVEGCYWVAMMEGQRLLRFAPDGALLQELRLPVRCATMPGFGDADLRTLYITTAREKRPADELAQQPWAGCLLKVRVPVPGLQPNRVHMG